MKDSDRSYTAGFFDGEGCVSIFGPNKNRVQIRIGQKDPTILEQIHELTGLGRIYRREDNGASKNGTLYSLVIYRKADVRRFIRLVYPFIRGPKKSQLRQAYHILQTVKEAT